MTEHPPRIRHVREVVRIAFYMPLNHHEVSATVSRALDMFLQAVGEGPEVIGFYRGLEGDRYPLNEAGWRFVRNELQAGSIRSVDDLDEEAFLRMEKQGLQTSIHLTGGTTGLSGYEFSYVARIPWRTPGDEVSAVGFSLPTEYLEAHGPERVRALAMELGGGLPFSSGHAGLAFCRALREDVFRYPGPDVPYVGIIDSLGTRVDGVHWLNFLGQPMLRALGGVEGLRTRLHSSETTVRELSGERVVVTLGMGPEAGDLTRGRDLPAYRELARVLEPWLYECPSYSPWSGYTHAEIRRWWRRFLD
jgi:hypothetical protein